MDLKAEHFERQVHSLEQGNDNWEAKYKARQSSQQLSTTTHIPYLQELSTKHEESKKELQELVASIEGV